VKFLPFLQNSLVILVFGGKQFLGSSVAALTKVFYLESCAADFFFVCGNSSHLVLGVLVALQASKSVRVEATCSQHEVSEK
jgi:hypothetical protein